MGFAAGHIHFSTAGFVYEEKNILPPVLVTHSHKCKMICMDLLTI
jgi:hypothetical protein